MPDYAKRHELGAFTNHIALMLSQHTPSSQHSPVGSLSASISAQHTLALMPFAAAATWGDVPASSLLVEFALIAVSTAS